MHMLIGIIKNEWIFVIFFLWLYHQAFKIYVLLPKFLYVRVGGDDPSNIGMSLSCKIFVNEEVVIYRKCFRILGGKLVLPILYLIGLISIVTAWYSVGPLTDFNARYQIYVLNI